jgi:hypothetical protein
LQDDYNFDIEGMIGAGAAPLDLEVDEYALLPGGELNSAKTTERRMLLTGVIRGTDWEDFHDKKEALVEEFAPDRYPKDANGWQPLRLRYTGAETHKEIEAHYERGLEGRVNAKTDPCFWERVAVRFRCPDPFWHEIGESAGGLDETDAATFRIVAGRLVSTGQWDELGPPDVLGTYTNIQAIAIGPDRHVFFGGNFLNFDNIANADYIVEYDPVAGTWGALQTGLNGYVRALTFGPDDLLYVGGNFTNAGGVAAADYVAVYDPAANTFAALDSTTAIATPGIGANPSIYDLVFGLDGTLYLSGDFLNAGGDANADYLCQWVTGADFSSVVGGCNQIAGALAIAPNGDLYIGGAFTNWGDANGDYIVMWDGSALNSLDTGCNAASTQDIVVANDGTVYLGGDWTAAGGVTVNYICLWNGTAFEAMSGGLNQAVSCLALGPDGILYAGGQFTADSGGKVSADRFIKWNGAAWAHLDIDLPGSPFGYAIACGNSDPVIEQNYDVYIGFTTTGAGDIAGTIILTNPGTAHLYPRIELVCTTSGTLYSIRNETTGKELLFQYTLLAGETLIINLMPPNRSIISSFFGPRPDAILPNSDFGSFSLQPGANQITCFVD